MNIQIGMSLVLTLTWVRILNPRLSEQHGMVTLQYSLIYLFQIHFHHCG